SSPLFLSSSPLLSPLLSSFLPSFILPSHFLFFYSSFSLNYDLILFSLLIIYFNFTLLGFFCLIGISLHS
uniref:Uncharacterized protein n=1 Tax=Strigops habroptila TaxID=2489341 RepID=A0A672VE65_STRHB